MPPCIVFRILGPLEVEVDDTLVEIGAEQLRRLLCLLLLEPGRVVASDALVLALWPKEGTVPRDPAAAVRTYASRLRHLLPEGVGPKAEGHGYRLEVKGAEIDAVSFEKMLTTTDALQSGNARQVATALREALALWRGPALAEFRSEEWAVGPAVRLEELRLVALERLADARLLLGEHVELCGDLERLVDEYPLRERLWAQLMTAQYRSGRQAEALRTYRRLRERLVEDLGIEPSAVLVELEAAVLRHDPNLEASPSAPSIGAGAGRGVLTFIFTDIEGSTSLLRRLGSETYAGLLEDHHGIIRTALRDHGGSEVLTQGDGFFATFVSPSACVAAAAEMQRAVAGHAWPAGAVVRVRMGIHTGEAATESTGLVGLDVHKAARIADVGYGGQVLVSASTAVIVRDLLPEDTRLCSLGSHRLKDLGSPEELFQLEAEGLDRHFPALRSLDNPELPNNLPVQVTSFIGREVELAEVSHLVESAPLVTLTGTGGCGKTRLALEAAAALLDGSGSGVWLVELAPIADSSAVPGVVASTLGIRTPQASSADALLEALSNQRMLIVLDNCEHLIDACAKLADSIGHGCPQVHLLATSREPLGVDGERVFWVRSLSLPPQVVGDVHDLAGSEAVALFVERARAFDGSFAVDASSAPLVAEVSRRLDGIPLALDLAAARLCSMSLAHLVERLDARFRLLTGGRRTALERHQTLRATVAWSYELLNPAEQAVLRRLSAFVGSFELDAAEAVCRSPGVDSFEVDDLVGSLVNKSLVIADRSSGSLRYRLLETIRQYAGEELLTTEGAAALQRLRGAHADFFLALAETAQSELAGPSQGEWLKRLDSEWDDIRAALAYLADQPDGAEGALRLIVSLRRFLISRGLTEAVPIVAAAVDRAESISESLPAWALMILSDLTFWEHEDRGRQYAERALALARPADDPRLLALAMAHAATWMADRPQEGDGDEAARLYEEAVHLARGLRDPVVLGEVLVSSVFMDLAETSRIEEALSLARQTGDLFVIFAAQCDLGWGKVVGGEVAAAQALLEDAAGAARQLGEEWLVDFCRGNLGVLGVLQGQFEDARALLRSDLIACRRRGLRYSEAWVMSMLAVCATGVDDLNRAAQLHGAADAIITRAPIPGNFQPLQRVREAGLTRLRSLMGNSEFEVAYHHGLELRFEDAVDLALERAALG